MTRDIFLFVAIVFLCVYSAARAERTVWYVHPDSALNSIQAGLDSCADYDTVLVAPATYIENIIWPNTQGIHLVSELGPEYTIIDGDSSGSVIACSSGIDTTTSIRGFTIQNGYSSWTGGGIDCWSSRFSIVDNILRNNTATHSGGAIHLQGSYAIISGNTIVRNSALTGQGGGIRVGYQSWAMITGNTITNNIANDGGGTYLRYWAGAEILYNTISDNTATVFGGGLSFNGEGSVSHNIISHNTASIGGGISRYYGEEGGSIEISYNSVKYNVAKDFGGGMSFKYGDFDTRVIIQDTIAYNSAPIGAGIYYCRAGSLTVIDSCTISANDGDGITCDSIRLLEIGLCDIFENSGYGIRNLDTILINAENNWWGDASGPYHPTANPIGLGDSVSDFVDFDPWLSWPVGVEERPIVKPVGTSKNLIATIFRGPLQLPEGKKCRVFDITGRVVEPDRITRGIYFIEIDNRIVQKVVKVR